MNDKQLRQDVIDELDFEPMIDSADIGVLAADSVITLTGHVPTYAQKIAAERAVWRVKGVKAVIQNIAVQYNGEGDEDLAKRALGVLRWDSTVPDDVHLTVHRGWITLTGEVTWQFQRTNAESALRRLVGVVGITNNIKLKPKASPQVDAVKRRIEDALKRSAEVEARQIRVDIRDAGKVTLEGRVDTWTERAAVERAAWSVPGVQAVVDHLAVG